MGAKKSLIMEPDQQLKVVLDKTCTARGDLFIFIAFFLSVVLTILGINLDEYYPQDKNGKIIALSTKLGDIEGGEITFTKKDQTLNMKAIPPLIEDLEREWAAKHGKELTSTKSKSKIISSKSELSKSPSKSPKGQYVFFFLLFS